MASASDLFGGSGVSELELVAGENLTAGDPISLGIDGKAYKSIGLLNNSSVASPLPLATTTRYHMDTVASKIVALGVNTADNNKLYTSVGTISANGALSWGAVTTHTMADTIAGTEWWDAIRQSANQLFLAYTRGGNLRCRIINYSGTTTTAGTEVSTAASNIAAGLVANLVADSTGRVLVVWWRNSASFALWSSRATVSGTTITLGAQTQIALSSGPNDTSSMRIELLYDATQDRVVMFTLYNVNPGGIYFPEYTLLDISTGTTVVSTTNLSTGSIGLGTYHIALSRVSGTSSYLMRYIGTTSTTTLARIFTISTTAFTLGAAVTLPQNSNTVQATNWVEDTVNNKIIFGFDSGGCAVYTRSGTTLTLESTDTNIVFSSSNLNFFSPYVVGTFSSLQQIYDFSRAIPRQVGTLNIFTSALTSQARLLTSTSGISYSIQREAGSKLGSSLSRNLISGKVTNENQIGVSTQTVSSGATAKIALRFNKTSPAKIVTGLSGLTPGVHYYSTPAGSIGVAGVIYLGYAKSTTELILANSSGAET